MDMNESSAADDREIALPIRLMFGIGNETFQGFSAVFEKKDGTGGIVNVWFNYGDNFSKVRFIDEGESRVVWTVKKELKEVGGGLFSKPKTETEVVFLFKELLIRRDVQLPHP